MKYLLWGLLALFAAAFVLVALLTVGWVIPA